MLVFSSWASNWQNIGKAGGLQALYHRRGHACHVEAKEICMGLPALGALRLHADHPKLHHNVLVSLAGSRLLKMVAPKISLLCGHVIGNGNFSFICLKTR